jgi:hypothetical protein
MPVIPSFTIDTIIDSKDSKGNIKGKTKLKMNYDTASKMLDFYSETITNDTDKTIIKIVEVEKAFEKRTFLQKLEDNIFFFTDFVFLLFGLIVGAISVFVILKIRKNIKYNSNVKGNHKKRQNFIIKNN